jgi:hypothetical protein
MTRDSRRAITLCRTEVRARERDILVDVIGEPGYGGLPPNFPPKP